MKFYKDHFGKWHDEKSFWNMANIFQPCFKRSLSTDLECGYDTDIVHLVCDSVKNFKNNPTVIDYLLMNMHFEAIKRYREIHGCTLMESRKMVDEIEKDMEKMKND